MGKMINLKGKKFGRWTVVGTAKGKRRETCGKIELYWPCVCDCGTGKDDPIYIIGHSLRHLTSTSCGCLREEKVYGGKPGQRSELTKSKFDESSRRALGGRKGLSLLPGARRPNAKNKKSHCKICGHKLSEYNFTGECWCHSIDDPSQNRAWEPGDHGSGIQGDERKPVSEMACTSISAVAGRYR
jgi:hypothetical protein